MEMESKTKRSKKKKTSDFQQVATDSACDIETDGEERLQVDGESQKEKDQKKKKSESGEGFHVDAASTQETVSANLREEDKSKRKKKKNDRHVEIAIDRIYDETLEEGRLEVDGEVQKETEQKMKKWKLNNNFEEIITEMKGGEESTENKKSARGEKDGKGRKSKGEKKIEDRGVGESMAFIEGENVEKVEKKKKRKREKQKENDNLVTGLQETVTEEDYGKEGSVLPEKDLGDGETDGQSTLSKSIGGEDKEGSKVEKKKKAKVVAESMTLSEGGNVEKKKKRKREKQKENDNGLQETVTEDYGKEGFVLPEKDLGVGETDGQSTLSKSIGSEDKEGSKAEKKKKTKAVAESMAFSEGGNVEKKKKRKREKQKENDNGLQETVTEDYAEEGSVLPEKDLGDGKTDGQSTLSKSIGSEDKEGSEVEKKKKTKAVADGSDSSEDPQPKRNSKKVSFSSDIEVFPKTVRGKRFTKEEDEIVKDSVLNYVKANGLGDEGVNMVMHCKSHPKIKNCWKEIGAALPYRPRSAIYYRAHNLFERSDTHKWTEEDYEFLQKAQEKYGNDWKSVAEELGRHRVHVKDAWRRIKLQNQKKGQWSQEEYQKLYDLVNMDLKMKLHAEEKKSKHGMIRDDIPWSAISEKLSTRNNALCCMKWYRQLRSSMVEGGYWADVDDYHLVGALYDMDATCEGDVDWDNLLQHRSGDLCRKRWNQMVLHIGYHGSKPFAEQVETLAQRYCPDLAEVREAWDSKPVTP